MKKSERITELEREVAILRAQVKALQTQAFYPSPCLPPNITIAGGLQWGSGRAFYTPDALRYAPKTYTVC